MNYVSWVHDPHYSKRNKTPVDTIIMHYISAMYINPRDPFHLDTIVEFIKNERISYHFLIERSVGQIIGFVDPEYAAWHAGRASLWGDTNINSRSVGVALIATPTSGFTKAQMGAARVLCRDLLFEYPRILLNRIVGHEHVAPKRKVDPGIHFPWKQFLYSLT